MKLDEKLEAGQGFSLDLKFLPEELDAVKNSMRDHWLGQIKQYAPDLWCKANRILPKTTVDLIRSTSLGSVDISCFERLRVAACV